MTAQLSRERLEEIVSDTTINQGSEFAIMARMLLAGMDSEPVALAGFDAASAIRSCMEEFPEHVHDIVEECAQIAENTISTSHAAPPAPVAVPDVVGKLLNILDRHTVELGWGEKPITLAELVIARDGREELDACRAAMQSEPVTAATVPELTNAQCLDFLTIAFRHATISGDIEFDDIRLGLKMALSAAPEQEV